MEVVRIISTSVKKNKALWIGGAVIVGAVLLFFYMRGSGSTQVVQSGVNPQQAALNAQLQMKQMEIQGQLALASMQVAAQDAAASKQLDALQIQSNTQLQGLELQLGNERYVTDKQSEVALASLSSQEAIQKLQIESDLAKEQLAGELSLAQQQLQADVYRQIFASQTEQNVAAINATANVSMQQIDAFKEVNLAQIYGDVQKTREMYSAQTSIAGMNMMGNMFSGILGLFSDVKLKKNIKSEGFRETGFFGANKTELPDYSYEYSAAIPGVRPKGRQYGVMAQDALLHDPGVAHYNSGYLEVDYSRLS